MPSFPELTYDVTNWIEALAGVCCCLITRLGHLTIARTLHHDSYLTYLYNLI